MLTPNLSLAPMNHLRAAFAAFAFCLTSVASFAIVDPALQAQLGNPTGATADTSNHTHYLIPRAQYSLDYNDTTHEANWVAWDYTSADSGSAGRSPNFFQDTTLPAGFYQVQTTDYSGSGYDRGHMSPSADRTDTRADNDATFFMSNMVPQSPDNNQGVWASFESYTRSLAAAGNEILITSGPSGFGGSNLASGVAIPGYTWKIALVVPVGPGSALSRITTSTRIITIKIPNIAGVRSTPWQNFVTSVAQIEADTGYTFLTAVPSSVASVLRTVVDGQTVAGAPAITSQPESQSTAVGGSASFSVTATGDDPLSYQWLKDDAEIAGATSDTFTLPDVHADDAGSYVVVVTNAVGATSSNAAALIVTGVPPGIVTPPASITASAGSTVNFSVTASGSPTLTYQWRKAGSPIGGATNAVLTLTNVQSVDAVAYDVVVTNSDGFVMSSPAVLTVNAAAPAITTQPPSTITANGGVNVNLSVVATGSAPLTYQWRKGTVPIAGNASASTATLTLANASSADSGSYDVVVSNGLGSVTSGASLVTVNAATILWDFTTANATSGVPADMTASAITQGNNNVSAAGNPVLIDGSSASPTSTFSGGGNGGIASRVLATNPTVLDQALNAYFQFTVTPDAAKKLVVTGLTFGTRSTGTGAQAFAVFTSFDNYASPVATGTIANNSAWTLKAPSFTALTGSTGAAITFRIFGYSGSGNAAVGTANWRVDDIRLTASTAIPSAAIAPAVTSTSPAAGTNGVAVSTPIAITFNQPVSVSSGWFSIASATSGPIAATVTGGPLTYTLTPPTSFTYGDTISVTIFAGKVTENDTHTLTLPADYSFSFGTGLPVAPAITAQPAPRTVPDGGATTFTVAASGTAPLTYQWRRNGTPITGNASASNPTLTLAVVSVADIGSFDCVVSNVAGSVTSVAATLTVTPVAPAIASQPLGKTVTVGAAATFTVTATGTAPLTYQWRKDGVPLVDGGGISGSASAGLTVAGATAASAGSYDVVVSNTVSSATSSAAALNVTTATLSLVTWNFDSATAPADPSSGLPADITGGTLSQGNNNGTTALITSTSASTPLSTFSGSNNAGAAARTGALVKTTGGSAYFEFTLTPAAGKQVVATAFSFGARSTGTGPTSYSVFSSVDGFAAPVATGTFGADSVWRINSPAFAGVRWAVDAPVTFRLYGYNGSGSAGTNTANWRVDDLKITVGTEFPPAIASTSPAAGATGVALNSAITITFNQPVNAAAAAFAVSTTLHGAVPVSVSGGPTTFTLTPTAPWSYSDLVSVSVLATEVTDLTGTLVMPANYAVSFATFSPVPPSITTPPVAQTATVGDNVTLTVAATGTGPLGYQWRKAGVAIAGNPSATTDTLTLTSVVTADAADYDCVVTNVAGSATSDAATLTVNKAAATVTISGLTATYDGAAHGVTVASNPAGLGVIVTYNGSPAAPANAGTYAVVATISDANYAGSAAASLTISPAAATVTLGGLSPTYDGTPRAVSATTVPAGVSVGITYDGSATAPINAGVYAIAATVTDGNYTGSASGMLVVSKATATISLSSSSQPYDGSPKSVITSTTPAGLPVSVTYDGSATPPTAVGSYAIAATISNTNYTGSATGTLTISPGSTTIVLGDLNQTYDGTPKEATAVTTPAGLTVDFTYDGNATAPTAPGSYAVVGTIDDPNYSGSATGTLVISTAVLVRHAPTLNAGLDGSLQLLLPESTTLNGNAWVSGDLLVPGTPNVQLNGHPTYGGTVDGTGGATPTNFTITLNGNALIRHVVRRTNAVAMPVVAAPPAPAGTRNVSLNSASDSPGDFATIRNLTLNGNAGTRTVPAGTYGMLTINGNSGLILGVAGATTPSIYNLQGLTLNGNSTLQIVGPVVINLASGVSVNGSLGDSGHPEWLQVNVASGGFTLNGNVTVSGSVTAPNGTVTINGNSKLNGNVAADRLTINGNGLIDTLP